MKSHLFLYITFITVLLFTACTQKTLRFTEEPTMIREFNHTKPAELLWELQITARENKSNIGWNIFRAERIELYENH